MNVVFRLQNFFLLRAFLILFLANCFTVLFALNCNKRRTLNVAVEYTAAPPRIWKVPCTSFGQPSGFPEILSVSINRSSDVPG